MINRDDLIALQSFVTEKDNSQYDDLHADTLLLDITHSNLKQRHVEIRFDKHTTISSLRDKVRSQRVIGSILSFFVHNNATTSCDHQLTLFVPITQACIKTF